MKPPNSKQTRAAAQFAQLALLVLLLPLAGCVSVRVHRVGKTVVAANVLDASLEQLIARMNAQYAAIQSINATVDIKASTGGAREGEVKEIPTFSGYIFLRKPDDLRVLLLLPFVRSRALDMVSDGKTFKLYLPPRNRAIVGTDRPVETSQHVAGATPADRNAGLETLRPYIIRDALLIPAVAPDELYTLTESSRLLPAEPGRKEAIEEPDYDVTILRRVSGQTLERVRVIHIGRIDLEPYEQDIYDHRGRVVTTVLYSKYSKSGDVSFPAHIFIRRPIDEYTLDIEVTRLQLNTHFDEETFLLTLPDRISIQKMP